MKKIDTILFDLDGTLVDSNELIIHSFKETMLKYLPNRDFSRSELIEMIGPPLRETFKIVTNDPEVIQEMIDYYRKVYVDNEFDYVTLYPNTLEMLEYFSNNKFNLGIVTTKFEESALPSIKHYGLDKYITSFCFLDDIKNPKPSADPIHFALSNFNKYNQVLMIGDNTGDIKAGHNANCLTCGIDWSIKRDLLKLEKPTFWIYDYSELKSLVNKYNKEE